ncbi:unnamed protein product [Cylicocyclus nassatus]|uniref:Uncharacterized protein n=1 Tax=Cylicocyclus nassatus TaxID=53992 RepID=A0AA36H7Q4_CYLNA|nr:unnamed protein product [Cylicocyclus nassatus]
MKDQRFRFIFFADEVKASEAMHWLKAIDKLEIAMSQSNRQTTFKQYLASDSDMEIVRAMIRLTHIEEHVLIIFTKEDGESIKDWYGVNISHVVGKGENVVDRIVGFAPRSINCVCVADLQYNTKEKEIDREKSLILNVTDTLFKERQGSTAGIWAYGSVAQKTDFTNVFNNMSDTYEKFEREAHTAMQRGYFVNDLGANFSTINTATGPEGKVDSLLFMWGADFVEKNWVITPSYNYTNIVVVSLQDANFTGHVDDRGEIINVVLNDYKDADVRKIVDALIHE